MKKTKTFYWICTILFMILMLISAISSFFPNPQGIAMMQHLGYPYSVLTLLSIAKILGIIAILIPGFPRLKEWAYAGFVFDLTGAFFAGLSAGDPVVQWIPVIIGVALVFVSYILYHRIKSASVIQR